jgi:hypothetical protein
MPSYMIWPRDDIDGEAYWVSASSPTEARQIVAMSIASAGGVMTSKFHCEPNSLKEPPAGLIYRRLNGPVEIKP